MNILLSLHYIIIYNIVWEKNIGKWKTPTLSSRKKAESVWFAPFSFCSFTFRSFELAQSIDRNINAIGYTSFFILTTEMLAELFWKISFAWFITVIQKYFSKHGNHSVFVRSWNIRHWFIVVNFSGLRI